MEISNYCSKQLSFPWKNVGYSLFESKKSINFIFLVSSILENVFVKLVSHESVIFLSRLSSENLVDTLKIETNVC